MACFLLKLQYLKKSSVGTDSTLDKSENAYSDEFLKWAKNSYSVANST